MSEPSAQQATHVYLAQKPCGCYVGGHVDDGSKDLRRWIGDWVVDGFKVVKVSIEEARGIELGCVHVESQKEMF